VSGKTEILSEIYDFDRGLQRTLDKIKKELSPDNQKLIIQYDKVMASQSISKAARRIHVQALLNLSRMMQKDWKDVTQNDIDDLVFKIMDRYANQKGQETWSSFDLKKVLKMFFRWYKLGSRDYKQVGDPPETKNVKPKPVRDTLAREDLVTESDLSRLLHACGENARDRAFIDCHAEAGTRPGEILNLQLKHLTFDQYGAVIRVDGKTGTRNIRLIKSVPNLAHWKNVHPFKDNPEAPLWIILKKEKFGKPFTYSAAMKMVKMRCEKAGLSKRINLKLFRHSEATNAAKFMTEAQLKMRHGWSHTSQMPARYVHLIDADVEEAIFDHYGIKKKSEEKLKFPKVCRICETSNTAESTACSKCGRPLDLKSAIEKEEKSANQINEKKMVELELRINSFENEKSALKKELNSKINEQSEVFEIMLDLFGMRDEFYQKRRQIISHMNDLL